MYMQARYYDPVIGRFYSNDPIGFRDVHSFNRYAYANNNPYKYTDPTGMASCSRSGGCSPSTNPRNTTGTNLGPIIRANMPSASAVAETAIDFTPVVGDVKGFADFAAEPSLTNGVAAVAGIVPVVGDAAAKAIKAFSKEKQALVDMAKMDKKGGGVTQGDMDAYSELNAELPDPFPANKVRGLESHPNRPHGQEPHGHVVPVNHIPEKKENE